ncbi:hypothetical protein AVEN_55650-1 [Araneus ventricosus]|uniref:Uncharacterized protein n=1 Tax=Araneus ventricosus TaxID=182803 RepID=A0A4Y2IIS9_ARAVE|nr:hypothetical protein AVEN_55650-1 [Araneus ventricosus]
MASFQENGTDQPNNIMEMFIDLKCEFSSFRIGINTKVDHISKQIAPEGIARQPELQEPSLHEELVKANLKPEVKTYVSAVRNSSSAVKSQIRLEVGHKWRQIRTKLQSYASFHVQVFESDFHLLSDASIWSEGCLVTEFFGRLKEDQIYPDNTNLPSEPGFTNIHAGNSK